LTITGSGTVELKGTNDNNLGNVTISSGTLSIAGGNALGNNSTVTIDSGANLAATANETIGALTGAGNLTFSNGVVLTVGANNQSTTFSGIAQGGSATSGLTKTGTGTLTLNGLSNYTGPTTVNAGTLLLDLSTNPTGVLSASSKPTLGGGTLQVNGQSSGTSSQTLGNMILTANTASSIVVNGNGGTGATLTLGSTWTRNAGSTLNINLAAVNSTLASGIALTNGILNASVTVTDATGTGFATTSGGDVVRYTATNQLTSAATAAGTNYYDNTSGTLTLSGTESINSLAINATSAGTLDLKSGTLTETSFGLLDTATAAYAISNGTLGANNKEVIVHQTSSSNLTISATVSGGTGSLTKDGAGNLILTHVNTFSGATNVFAGTLQLGDGTNNGGVGGNILNNAAVVFNSGAAQTFSGNISGTGTLTQQGSANLTLSGNNSFTGVTTVSAGTLTLAGTGGNQALAGTSSIIINSGGTLLTSTGNQTNGAANLTLNGGTLALNGQTNGAVGTPGLNVLTLTASSTLDLGSSGGSVIVFANSSAATWTGGTTLSITNWDGGFGTTGSNQIFFGSDGTGLTTAQLSQIEFFNPSGQLVADGANLLSTGELVTPVPEPSTYLAGGTLLLLASLREWRRRQHRATA
jgi:autotransporter-associated beta strand protein